MTMHSAHFGIDSRLRTTPVCMFTLAGGNLGRMPICNCYAYVTTCSTLETSAFEFGNSVDGFTFSTYRDELG